ncbi:uncharacterized protein [Drosophila tropicalis]|uniref:uncharacterized protein isoform X4 n=1 Tax=Drosophila tropicalis TaxID=46794 RepID=UPI0035AC1252
MGGGFAAPPIILASKQQALRMHEKLLEKEEKTATVGTGDASDDAPKSRKEKTEKVKLAKPSKFAERLRRSFRRSEHRSLEIKRHEPTAEELKVKSRRTPSPPSVTGPAVGTATATGSASASSSCSLWPNNNLVQLHLPGLALGGHINPALLLDSPDECTPPEYAYQHLSSVATTNSSTSLESNCEQLSELSSSQTSVYYWTAAVVTTSTNACPMGGEVSTAAPSSNPVTGPNGATTATTGLTATAAAPPPTSTTTNTTSRSCSLTSESSSVRLTRLQNFLFKSSNESSRSYLGHSNEGFTASSHNSSSGEWEQLGGGVGGGSSIGAYGHDFHGSSFPEETTPDETDTLPVESSVGTSDSAAGQYYQYTLTSPNNPFLPEITARTYHSTYSEEQEQGSGGHCEQLEEDSRSAQLPTPAYSRAGSQESSTHSESGISCPPGPTPSPASSSSSTPGRHRRKLFSLNSPTRLLHHQSPTNTNAPAVSSSAPTPVTMGGGESSSKFNSATLVRSLNPFLPASSSSASNMTSPKRAPLKQTAAIVTSPGSVTPDLSTKREEFLRATMKICLVVSPPTSKLQLKSKSLTHLDGLDTVVACQHGTATTTAAGTAGAGPAMASTTTTTATMGAGAASLGRQSIVVSSSEFFSVLFCLESTQQPDEEFIPATKGVTLLNALSHALRVRNLSFNQITITDNYPTPSFLDAGPSPLTSSLDEQTDVENLAGHHLIITERESSRKTLQKAASFGSRQRPPRLLSSASTEETSESAGAAGKQIKQRWTSIFGIKNPQQSQLCELLNSYAKNGVPQRPDALNFDHPDLVNSLAYLQNMDKSWLDFVHHEAMSESEIKIQTAIWELVTTEVYYIHALQTVTDLFLACLEAVQEERLLIDVDQHRLFSNIRSVCEANIKFWTLWLYPMVAHSVVTHEPMRCAFFQEGFIAFASIFAPYKIYCAEQSTCQFYCKELNQNNALFTSYLAWCESQKMCNRLRLADIVVRPMQRLTKYSLLLAAIKKHMSDVEEIEAMDVMIHSVENFVGSVNNHLTMRQENERLKGVMARIESYDVVDTNNEVLDKLIKHHSQMFDLCAPMRGCPAYPVRHLFMEGDHKFKDNLGKSDVHCFLLTDLLLVCKTIAKKGLGALKVIRQPYLTDQLMVHLAPNNTLNCVYLNEFQVATTAFTLQCTEAKNWCDALWRAKTIYQRLKRGSGGGSSGVGGNVGDSFRFGGSATSGGTADSLGVRKSPMNSSICSHVSSANNSHSGSVEWNDSRNISVDFEKTNSVSSDEGSSIMTGNHGLVLKGKQQLIGGLHKAKVGTIASTSANTLSVQPLNHLGQSLPNLNMHHSHTNLYHTYSNNTLLVPGTTTSHSGNLLLSPSHRGISYPPPSPTRVPLRRGMAFSTSTKNPPLRKTRNVTSQNSINWHQIPATPTPPSPRSQHQSPSSSTGTGTNTVTSTGIIPLQKSMPLLDNANGGPPPILQKQLSHQAPLPTSNHNLMELQRPLSNETDV